MSVPVRAGRWAATVELTDLQHHEEGLLTGASRGKGMAVLTVPAWAGGPRGTASEGSSAAPGPRLSDPEFRLASGRGELLPHPERVYGLAQDTLRVYLEADGIAADTLATVELEIHDPVSGTRGKDTIVLHPEDGAGGRAAALYTLPLDSFLGGAYVLRCTPFWDRTAVAEAEFSVSWRMETVTTGGRDMQLEAELLLSSKEAGVFKQASPAARLRTLQGLWDSLDPTPGTAENEVYDEFLARVAYAQRYFGEQLVPGQRTARGRTYIRFGAPAEVTLEVVPYNEVELEDAITSVHETLRTEPAGAQFKQVVPETPPGIRAQRDREISETRANSEGAAFELWRYQMAGDPLISAPAVLADNVHLRFLFVDRLGTGEYRLEFTNLPEAR
jgi:GWxTD domain-containing protein